MFRGCRVLLIACALPNALSAQAVKASCLPADAMSARIVRFFGSLVTPATAADTAERSRLKLDDVTPAQIVHVADAPLCFKAGQAMDKMAKTKKQEYQLYVVRVGDAYGVMDTTWRSGEYIPLVLFDAHWKLRDVLLSF